MKRCPKCGGTLREQPKFEGLWTCSEAGCQGMELTPDGARSFHEELCRQSGMTADQIVASWNKANPGDEW